MAPSTVLSTSREISSASSSEANLGFRWAQLVPVSVLLEMKISEQRYQELLFELVRTENRYSCSLSNMRRFYCVPLAAPWVEFGRLKGGSDMKTLTLRDQELSPKREEALQTLLKDLELRLPSPLYILIRSIHDLDQAHAGLSRDLNASFETEFPVCQGLAQIVLKHIQILDQYVAYCSALSEASRELEDARIQAETFGKGGWGAALANGNGEYWELHKTTARRSTQLGRFLQNLEKRALAKGIPQLSDCLARPLARLFQYPVLVRSMISKCHSKGEDFVNLNDLLVRLEGKLRKIEELTSYADRERRVSSFIARTKDLPYGLKRSLHGCTILRECPGEAGDDAQIWCVSLEHEIIQVLKTGEAHPPVSPTARSASKVRASGSRPVENMYKFVGIIKAQPPPERLSGGPRLSRMTSASRFDSILECECPSETDGTVRPSSSSTIASFECMGNEEYESASECETTSTSTFTSSKPSRLSYF